MLSTEFMSALNRWIEAGDRNIDIKASSRNAKGGTSTSIEIWCYDYLIRNGKFIHNMDDIPTTEELVSDKLKTAKEELERLTAQ